MKTSKIDRFVSVIVVGICLIKAVLYGGSKPPVSTNTPPSDISGDLQTNPPPMICFSPRPMMSPPAEQTENEPSATYHLSLIPQTSWNTRGAYCDWTRVDFPDGFAFPSGTNLLSGVTLMAYGEIRESLRCSPSTLTLSLPLPVSLEPGVSTCAYGLTASNSFVFAWQDACVERDGTNRVDAAIELFASGDVQVRFGDSVTNIVARPPEGFVGEGQDADWVTNAFPASAADIVEKGYERWLEEDCVGIEEENGIYQAKITVHSLPSNGEPCYLVCGPYKVVVTQPGTYSFPLEVFDHYQARTYPTAVPISVDYDDGFADDEPLLLMSPPQRLLGGSSSNEVDVHMDPTMTLSPSTVPLSSAAGTTITIKCNVGGAVRNYFRSMWNTTKIIFRGSREAEIEEALVDEAVEFILETDKGSCSAVLTITPTHHDDTDRPIRCCGACCGEYCNCDGSCCRCNCGCHSGSHSNTNSTSGGPRP